MKGLIKYICASQLAIILTACGSKPTGEESKASMPEDQVTLTQAQLISGKIKTGQLQQKKLSTVIRVNGVIDVPPQNMVSVSLPFGGYLKSTDLLPGMHIRKGDILAIVEDQQYIQLQQDYLTAKAKLEFLEEEYKRQKDLNESKATSDKVLQQASMELKTQTILCNSLAEKLKLIGIQPSSLSSSSISKSIKVSSPIDGYVSSVNVNIGKYASPSDILFELVNPEDIHLNLNVFEKDLEKLSIGQKLMAFTNNHPDKKYPCEIILISKNLTKERTAEVHCHFESYDKSLLPGMYMNAEIEVNSNNLWALPASAVVNFEGKEFVFTAISKDTFKMQEVETGASENEFIEIKNPGSLSGKSIVTEGAYTLLMANKNKSEE